MRFWSCESIPEQSQDLGQQVTLVVRIEHRLSNPVKSIPKDALGGSLMLLNTNRFDHMSPGTDVIGPAKSDSQDSKQRL